MKRIIFLMLSIVLTGSLLGQTNLAYFPFTGNEATPNTATSYTATAGTQANSAGIYLDGTHGSSLWDQATELTSNNGSSINTLGGEASGKDLALISSTANGKSMVMHFSTTGFQDIVVSFAYRGTSTGFNSHVWSYSTDGTNFTEITGTATTDATSTYMLKTVDLSAISAVDEQANVYLKLTVNGASSANGSNRFDNIQINGNPAGPDIYPPLISGFEVVNASTIQVTFNEDMATTSAENTSNYSIQGNYTISTASLSNNRTVTVSITPALDEGNTYTMSVANVEDLAGNEMADSTFDFTFGVATEFHVADIAALRAKWESPLNVDAVSYGDQEYKLTGNVIITAINNSYRNQKFIQDASGAIVIDDANGVITRALEVGDEINALYGTLTDYYGQLQFVATKNCSEIISPFNSVAPLEITLTQLQDVNFMNEHQSELIKIVNAEFTTSGSFANGNKYSLAQGNTTAEAVWIHIYNIPSITGAAIPTGNLDVIGVNKISYGVYYLIPRTGNDFQDHIGISNLNLEKHINIYPNPVIDLFTINFEETQIQLDNVKIFDANGKLLLDNQLHNNDMIDISAFNSGIYFIKLSNNNDSFITKLIKQ